MTRRAGVLSIALCALLAAAAAPLSAQEQRRPGVRPPVGVKPRPAEPGRPGSFELLVGGELLFPESLGSSTATLLRNDSGSSPYNLFSTSATRKAAPAFRGEIGYNITRAFAVVGGFQAARGNLSGTVSNDVENAAGVTLGGRITQYVFDVSVLAHLRQMAFSSGAGVPYLEAGAGYLRQMQEGNFAPETGQVYHFGGGVRYIISRKQGGRLAAYGIRVGARAYVQNKGYSFGTAQRVYGAVTGGLLMMF